MQHQHADGEAAWMRRAIELAARGRYGTSPNPMVGAVVVDTDGRVAGEGYHEFFGGPHAEVMALRAAGERARGGTLLVTLEPCAHQGKTPPCVDAIVSAGVQRVVVAMRDPNPEASGGIDRLRAEGIDVNLHSDANGARVLNRRWVKWVQDRKPWVTLKAAVSLDGRIATRSGESQWITGEAARRRGLELREEHDAILVGVETVLADDPRLTRRLGLNPTDNWQRVVVDSKLRTPSDATVVCDEPGKTLIAHTPRADGDDRRRLEAAGVQLAEIPADARDQVDILRLLEVLGRRGVAALLVEGGARVHGSFVDTGCVDEVVFFVAPLLIGGSAPPAVAGRGFAELGSIPRFRFEALDRHGDDLELRAVRPEAEDVYGTD